MSPITAEATQIMLQVDLHGQSHENDDIEKVSELCGQKLEEVIEEKTRKGTVSIDVTKALLLLGFTSWSGIEPGMRVWKI